MKKIIFLSSYYDPYIIGGAEISNKILVEGISKKNKVKILSFGKKTKINKINKNLILKNIFINNVIKKKIEYYEESKVESKVDKILRILYRLDTYFNSYKYQKIVEKELENNEYKIFHSSGINLFFPHFWWKIANKKNSVVIHTLRDPILIYSKTVPSSKIINKIFDKIHRMFYIKYIEKYVDYIHSPTQYMIDLHIKNGFKFKNSQVIPNTINIEFKEVNYSKKVYDLIYVGTLAENKGLKTLIKLKTQNPYLNILFVGDGPLKTEIEKFGYKTTGWLMQSKVFDLIEKSKILVLPSEWEEAFGRVLVEAVALGTISIGSNMGGIPEVLFNDSNYIFEAKNIVELKQKIKRILSLNEEEYKKELLKLQEKMKIYKYENHIKEFEEFYNKVLENRS